MHRHVYITSAHPAQAVKGTADYADASRPIS